MNKLMDLNKLEELHDKKIITDIEFEEHKRTLFNKALRKSGERKNPKSGIIYILLAWFLGTIGIHNFYAGYTIRGIVQLLLTLLSPLFLFVPLIFTALWAFAELLFQNKSRDNKKFSGNKKIITALRIVSIIWLVLAFSSASLVDVQIPLDLPSEDIFINGF